MTMPPNKQPTTDAPRRLKPIQFKAMALILEGASLQDVADQLGVTRQTISGWKNHHPGFKAMLDQLRDEAQEALQYAAPRNEASMLSALMKLAHDGPPETRLKAIQFYFDRFSVRNESNGLEPLGEHEALIIRAIERRRGDSLPERAT